MFPIDKNSLSVDFKLSRLVHIILIEISHELTLDFRFEDFTFFCSYILPTETMQCRVSKFHVIVLSAVSK